MQWLERGGRAVLWTGKGNSQHAVDLFSGLSAAREEKTVQRFQE